MAVMPREGKWTLQCLDELPDDGQRYEVVDGLLLVTPAPVPRHQRAVGEIFFALRSGVPADLEVFVAPLDYRPTSRRSLQPGRPSGSSTALVDPDPEQPSITVLELDAEGDYRGSACAVGDDPLTVRRPFRVTLIPSALVAG